MQKLPTIEDRVGGLEYSATILNARLSELQRNIGEVKEEVENSFKALAGYQIRLEQDLNTRFEKLDKKVDAMDGKIDALRKEVKDSESRLLAAIEQLTKKG